MFYKLSAQTYEFGSWNIVNVKFNINDKFSFFSEAQLRSLKFYDNFHYYEYKGGVNYKLHKNVKLTLGTGSYQTYKEGGNFVLPKNNDELRLWPQIIFFQSFDNLKLEQRYRTELRFTSNGYRNRFRYRFSISYPFGKIINEYRPFQISISNELFFSDVEPYFERNRFQLAFNYKLLKTTSLQIAYLHQFDYKIFDEIGRQFFVIGLYFEISRISVSDEPIIYELKDN